MDKGIATHYFDPLFRVVPDFVCAFVSFAFAACFDARSSARSWIADF
jgi:hypothetical protein